MAITRRIRGRKTSKKGKQLILSQGAFKRMQVRTVLRETASK